MERSRRRAVVAGVLLAATSAACGVLLGVQDLQSGDDSGARSDAARDALGGDARADSSMPSDVMDSSLLSDSNYGVRCGADLNFRCLIGLCCETLDGSALTFFCSPNYTACKDAGGDWFACADQTDCLDLDPSKSVCCLPSSGATATVCRIPDASCTGPVMCDPSRNGADCPMAAPVCGPAAGVLGGYGYFACAGGG